MKCSIERSALARALKIAGHAVAGKSTLPVLSNVLLRVEDDVLTVSATNLEISITTRVALRAGRDAADGAVTVPAKLLTDVVSGLDGEIVDLAMLNPVTQVLAVTCDRFEGNIKGIEADEFPVIPTVAAAAVVLPAAALREAIEQVVVAAATDDTRPILTGVLIRGGDVLTLAAADGFRLVKRDVKLDQPLKLDTHDAVSASNANAVVVPARGLAQLAKFIDSDEVSMAVSPSGSQIAFETDETTLVSRLIEGKFPDFERIIPAQHATRLDVDKAALVAALKLAGYFASASANIVKLTIKARDGQSMLTVSANAAEVGDNKIDVPIKWHGESIVIALSAKYLADAVAVTPGPEIVIELQTPQSPAVLKSAAEPGYTHVVMPMTVR